LGSARAACHIQRQFPARGHVAHRRLAVTR
jgi:hypothetical protein